jgi:hypothetical protein
MTGKKNTMINDRSLSNSTVTAIMHVERHALKQA